MLILSELVDAKYSKISFLMEYANLLDLPRSGHILSIPLCLLKKGVDMYNFIVFMSKKKEISLIMSRAYVASWQGVIVLHPDNISQPAWMGLPLKSRLALSVYVCV